MSKEVDLANINQDEIDYVKERPWLLEEARLQGHDIPEKAEEAPDSPVVWKTGTEWTQAEKPAAAAEQDEEEEEAEADDDYEEQTMAQLQEELENRDLPKSGNKAELIARLREDDESEEE